ncbi:MAG: pyridoxamine 5'-phosphate oxidase family protein [Lautropia sp.]
MNTRQAAGLRALLRDASHGALATVHDGDPQVSMVPYATLPDAAALVIHVSALAAHTGHMLAHPRVALLVTAAPAPAVAPQALPRVSIAALARRVPDTDPSHPAAKAAYLARFPPSAPIFDLPDFSLFVLEATSLRLVLGFGNASTLDAQDLRRALGRAGTARKPAHPPPEST